MVYCSCGARGVSRVALDTPDIWSVTPKMYMLLFHFLCLIVLKEAFILAVNSRMQVMRCVRCPASRFIASISSLSRAFAPHVQWAELTEMTEQEKKVSALKFSLIYEEFQTIMTGSELFSRVTDHARSRFAGAEPGAGRGHHWSKLGHPAQNCSSPSWELQTASPMGRYGECLQRDSCLKIHM